MTKLGKINFYDYDSDSDNFCVGNKFTSSSDNIYKNQSRNMKRNINSSSFFSKSNTSFSSDKNFLKKKVSLSDSDSDSDSQCINSYDLQSKHIISDCEIVTYDNTKDYDEEKKKRIKDNFFKIKEKVKNDFNNCDVSDNDMSDNNCELNISDFINFSSDCDVCSICKNLNSSCTCSSSNSRCNYEPFDDNISECKDNICAEKKVKNGKVKIYENNICNFDQLDIVAKKLEKVIESFKTISHLLQYYLRMLEQVKIDVSQFDISHAVNACIETSVSLASYIKADIQRNKTYVLDDKYNNRDGYYLTNGVTKIYYIEKIKLSLLKNGELIFAIYEEKNGLRQYDLGGDYANANYEGDLYSLIDLAKEKAIHFNNYIKRKHMKVTSLFNMHLIFINKYK